MAGSEGGGGCGGGRAAPPPRPTLALPPRSSLESLFRSGAADVSPGPMTLVASFFADDPDSECRSFSQLLAGAMNSPAAAAGGTGRMEQGRPAGLLVAPSPFFTVPQGFSPAGLLDSPGFFMPGLGHFGMSHQEALAQVTAQANQSNSRMHFQAEYPSLSEGTSVSLEQPTGSTINMEPIHHTEPHTSETNNIAVENEEGHQTDQRSQPTALVVDKPADDGYNWRKYGQKQVKGSEYPRSYYKCTHPNCPVKKKVERSLNGHVTEIIYKGQHNHQRPPANRRAKDSAAFQGVSNELNENTEPGSCAHPENSVAPSKSKRDRESGYGTTEQSSGSSDGEEMDGPVRRTDEVVDSETAPKRRNVDTKVIESTSHKAMTEPRIIVQTTSEVDLLDDGYRWRKYGQKVVKGNPHPRSYYKCTNVGCNVRKHVERASTDAKAVITTYEGKHNHDVPTARNSSHNTAKVQSALLNNHGFPRETDIKHERRPAVLQMKEEYEIT